MKVVIVNCFDTYEDRIDLLHTYFVKRGYEVTVIQSNFRHFKKIFRTENKPNFVLVKSKPYYKNMSLARLISHYSFSKDAFKRIEEISPDIIYATIPPNSITKFAAQYKKKNSDVKLIFDLIDLWPETMPVGKIKNLPPFTFWKLVRDNNLKYANLILTECDLYQDILKKKLKNIKTNTLHLAKKDFEIKYQPLIDIDEINVCYLGSINNIIDIPMIKKIIEGFSRIKPTTFHVIGDGESKDYLLEEINKTNARIEYYGKVYNHEEKQQIFDKCHFGLNIMKNDVCVGLTMKSIDYFQHGLPIINNIKADTTRIVAQNNIGFNIEENLEEVLLQIRNMEVLDYIEMRRNTKKVFNKMFSQEAFENKLTKVLERINI